MSDPHNWGEFVQRPSGPRRPADDPDFDDICARALSGIAGQELLAVLRDRFIERGENPLTSEAALRVRVTQQQFVRELQAARDRGLDAAKSKAAATAKSTAT